MSKIITLTYKNKILYYDVDSAQNSYDISYLENNIFEINKPNQITFNNYPRITFCLEITNFCNLNCKYCFNSSKNNAMMTNEQITKILDKLFSLYPNKEKYFIDLSGDGEPLTNLDGVLFIEEYALKKQEEIRKEINISFVTNGTLLTKENVRKLENKGTIIYGISIDGTKRVHDSNRVFSNNKGTFKSIIKNLNNITKKEFLGCAVTISNNVFSLKKELVKLNKYFNTISVKPVRSLFLTKDLVEKWIKEYEILTDYLLLSIQKKDYSLLFSLLNGDDYFGKFIIKAFMGGISLNRCDAGAGRIFVDINNNVFPCVALAQYKLQYSNINLLEPNFFQELLNKGLNKSECKNCDYINICGGECFVEQQMHNGLNQNMCLLKKKLIILSLYFKEESKSIGNSYQTIKDFIVEKRKLLGVDKEYKKIVEQNTTKTFEQCKELYYKSINRDRKSIKNKLNK